MLDMRKVRDNPADIQALLRRKQPDVDLGRLLETDGRRRQLLHEVEERRALLNRVNKDIGALKQKGEDAGTAIHEMREVSGRIKSLEAEITALEAELESLSLALPNIPHPSVPIGGMEKNALVREWGQKPSFSYTPRTHFDLAEQHGLVDFKRGAKIAGSGFLLFKGSGARLERALIQFFIDTHCRQNGFEEVSTPFLASRRCMTGTGQLPKLEADMYHLDGEDLFLIPTAEVPVTNMYQDEILEARELPKKAVAYSPCFRREAGSYGKDTRGMVRVHQFDKVEMVAWTRPEDSYDMLETLTGHAANLLEQLGLPYRVVTLATGDMSFAAAKTYDIEVWAPGMGRYLEVSSISNFEDFQARRSGIRYRPPSSGKPEWVHTLNGSGLALPRTFVALLENHQNADGTITLPEVLIPYMGGKTVLP